MQRKVVLSFVVTPDGGVRDIKVVKHFKPDFDSVAVNTVATWRFEPATKAGKAVAVRLETEIKFTPQ
jgi:TonB family protein